MDNTYSKSFIKGISEANQPRDDPHNDQFKLSSTYVKSSQPLLSEKLTEFPDKKQRDRVSQGAFLEEVVPDVSDMEKGVYDLDTATNNDTFLKTAMRAMVARDNELIQQPTLREISQKLEEIRTL